MYRTLLAIAALFLAALTSFSAHAQQWLPGAQGIPIVCAYNSSPPSFASGSFVYAQCDATGVLAGGGGGGGGGTVTQGTAAAVSGAWPSLMVYSLGGTLTATPGTTYGPDVDCNVSSTLCSLLASALPAGTNLIGSVTAVASGAITNPTSTLTLTSATTAYTANQLIASSATAGSIVVPSFSIANSAGGAIIPRLRLSTNDATSTAWGSQVITIDLWSAAPTFTNGDRAAFLPATGTASHIATFSCTMSAEYGDGAFAECSPSVGNATLPKLASGTSVFWTLKASGGSGVTGASKVFTLTAEELN